MFLLFRKINSKKGDERLLLVINYRSYRVAKYGIISYCHSLTWGLLTRTKVVTNLTKCTVVVSGQFLFADCAI